MKGIWRCSLIHWIRSWRRQRTGKSLRGMDSLVEGSLGSVCVRRHVPFKGKSQFPCDVWVMLVCRLGIVVQTSCISMSLCLKHPKISYLCFSTSCIYASSVQGGG